MTQILVPVNESSNPLMALKHALNVYGKGSVASITTYAMFSLPYIDTLENSLVKISLATGNPSAQN
ncbi:hypothetical protein [Polynucleobacter necessarius]|uniref:hypothetical protein n=1 Tax=Polynucleobacter necessarius TaxID=576610 RepID=UPI0013B064FB|nr:hypothetical protein [Polynucleobacter necessarius]